LAKAVLPGGRVKLGSLLSDIGKTASLSDSEIDFLNDLRTKTPELPVDFE
jgi:hypothetical protein